MYKVNCGQAPKYISDLVSTVTATATRPGLRSGKTTNYCPPRLRTKFGERGFSYSGPEQGMGRWVMGQMGHENRMGHMVMGH